MALDTAAKRWAVPGVGRPWMRSNLPNTAKDETWRPGAGNAYPVATFSSGNAFQVAWARNANTLIKVA